MSQVILQPCGSKDALSHYQDTILKPVSINVLKKYLSKSDLDLLIGLYPSGEIPTWGVTPGKTNSNQKKWSKIQTGDVTVFSAKGHIFGSGVVSHKAHNKDLAIEIWGYDDEGQTWEYIYFLDEIKTHAIPYLQMNQAVGYADNFVIQGFSILDEEKSELLLSAFNLQSEVYLPSISESEYENEIVDFEFGTELDKVGKTKMRKEQGFLRKQLFKNKRVACCGICGNEYPIEFLVTAHIKKRAQCSHDERLDYKNVVMPMCKFGCDDLFERKYIVIIDGLIQKNPQKNLSTKDLDKKIIELEGRQCTHWNESSASYFDWHLKQSN